jgi:hypothetical protein
LEGLATFFPLKTLARLCVELEFRSSPEQAALNCPKLVPVNGRCRKRKKKKKRIQKKEKNVSTTPLPSFLLLAPGTPVAIVSYVPPAFSNFLQKQLSTGKKLKKVRLHASRTELSHDFIFGLQRTSIPSTPL